MKRILIFFGGCSTEYAVSLQSAAAVLTHLDNSRYQPVLVGITRQGEWRYYSGAPEDIAADCWQEKGSVPCLLDPSRGAKRLILLDKDRTCLGFDAAFPLLHGKNGEDGTLQGLHRVYISRYAVIGPGCRIYQNVTIGEIGHRAPVIGPGCLIGAGAILVGGITVGEGARIGVGAVVRQDVPARSVVLAVPPCILERSALDDKK